MTKFARVGLPGNEIPVVSVVEGEWRDVSGLVPEINGESLSETWTADSVEGLPEVDVSGVRFGTPVAGTGKIVCVGLNYQAHADETGLNAPAEPILFLKGPHTLCGAHDPVRLPKDSLTLDWEVELAVVIGKRAIYLDSPSDAPAHIGGFAISNDVSERSFQLERGGQWDKGKNCETFNPLGPWIVSAQDVTDPQDLALNLWVNGDLRQSGTTAEMIFGVNELIFYISQFMPLEPGDLINTGTPAGVSLSTPDTPYLKIGDYVELEIEGLGRQGQEIVSHM